MWAFAERMASAELRVKVDAEGIVEFIARYQKNDHEQQIHEVSRFIRENGKWAYLDGDY